MVHVLKQKPMFKVITIGTGAEFPLFTKWQLALEPDPHLPSAQPIQQA